MARVPPGATHPAQVPVAWLGAVRLSWAISVAALFLLVERAAAVRGTLEPAAG